MRALFLLQPWTRLAPAAAEREAAATDARTRLDGVVAQVLRVLFGCHMCDRSRHGVPPVVCRY